MIAGGSVGRSSDAVYALIRISAPVTCARPFGSAVGAGIPNPNPTHSKENETMTIPNKISTEQRRQMIAQAAYFRAEHRGFNGGDGDAFSDWVQAEGEVDERLRKIEIEHFIERLEEVLLAANKKLTTLKRKTAGLKTDARTEWHQDVERLTKLRDALRPKLEEIRTQGERAGRQLRGQAEKIWDELSEITRRGARQRG
jgi:hypothetical protein